LLLGRLAQQRSDLRRQGLPAQSGCGRLPQAAALGLLAAAEQPQARARSALTVHRPIRPAQEPRQWQAGAACASAASTSLHGCIRDRSKFGKQGMSRQA
jgi:hypothetical protein